MKDTHGSDGDLLADKMEIELDVLRPLMLHGIGRKIYRTDVVAINQGGLRWRGMKFMEKLVEPSDLSNGVGDGAVLGLGTGARYCMLAFRRPGHQVVTEEDSIAGCGAASIRTTSPVGVRIDDEVCSGRTLNVEAQVQCTPKIAQNPFESTEMWLTRVMHMKTYLLDSIGDIWASEGEVLKCASETAKVGWVSNWGTLTA